MSNTSVIVIGAGIAGLKAALDCASQGISVTVLEARNRVGGRVQTIRGPNDEPIELGASHWEGFLHMDIFQNYFSQQDKQKPVISKKDILRSALYSKQQATKAIYRLPNARFRVLYQLSMLIYQELSADNSLFTEAVEDLLNKKQFNIPTHDQLTEIEYSLLKKLVYFHHAEQSTNPDVMGFYQLPPDYEADPFYHSHESYNREDAIQTFVANGYEKLPIQIKNACAQKGVQFVFNCPVSRVQQNENGVTVCSDKKQFHADYVICALPEGVLKKQAESMFEPALPHNKIAAFKTLGIHQSQRIVLQFDELYWDADTGPFIFVSDDDTNTLKEIRNFYAINGQYCLHSDSYVGASKEDVSQQLLRDLRAIYPNIADPIHCYFHNWAEDPYSCGAYPYPSPSMSLRDQQALKEPFNRIHFAGVYTSPHGESVHHAYASGLKAAEGVIQMCKESG